MIKKFLKTIVAVVGTISMLSCSKDTVQDNEQKSTDAFRVFVPILQTKTVNDGLSTKWEATDRIGLSYAVAGTADYSATKRFDIQDVETGMAILNSGGTLELDVDTQYDWYAIYPYNGNYKPNGGTGSVIIGSKPSDYQTQSGNDSMTHILGQITITKNTFPMYGLVKNVPGSEYPVIQMKHVASLVEYKISNALDKDIIITNITLTSSEFIVGYCKIAYNSDEPVLTPSNASNTAILNVTDGAPIAKGESACFYAGIFPCTIPAESPLTITVSVSSSDGSTGEQTFSLTPAESISFRSGKIKTLNLNFSQAF